jgi:hypothetical protein
MVLVEIFANLENQPENPSQIRMGGICTPNQNWINIMENDY